MYKDLLKTTYSSFLTIIICLASSSAHADHFKVGTCLFSSGKPPEYYKIIGINKDSYTVKTYMPEQDHGKFALPPIPLSFKSMESGTLLNIECSEVP